MAGDQDKDAPSGSTSLAVMFQINRIGLLERFLTAEQVSRLRAELETYYGIMLEQSEAVKRKAADPETRGKPPRKDDEINILGASADPHYRAIKSMLESSGLPEMLKPTGLRKADGSPSGHTTLAERLCLALCEFQTERAKLDTGQTDLGTRCDWRDECVAQLIEAAFSDLAEAAQQAHATLHIHRK